MIEKIILLNTLGQEAIFINKPKREQEIDFSHLPTRIYFINAKTDMDDKNINEIEEQFNFAVLNCGTLKAELAKTIQNSEFLYSAEFTRLKNVISLAEGDVDLLYQKRYLLMSEYEFIMVGNFITPSEIIPNKQIKERLVSTANCKLEGDTILTGRTWEQNQIFVEINKLFGSLFENEILNIISIRQIR